MLDTLARKMLERELPGGRKNGRSERRGHVPVVGVTEKDAEDQLRRKQMICCGGH